MCQSGIVVNTGIVLISAEVRRPRRIGVEGRRRRCRRYAGASVIDTGELRTVLRGEVLVLSLFVCRLDVLLVRELRLLR